MQADGPVAVPVNSTLVVRSTGKLNIAVSGTGGVAASNEDVHAPAGTQERRFKIAGTGTATLRGAGDDLTWPFNAIPDRPPTIALTKDPEQQNRGSLLLSYRLEDDYGVSQAEATFARKDDPDAQGRRPPPSRIRCSVRPISRWSCRRRAPKTASARPSRISPIIPGPAPM